MPCLFASIHNPNRFNRQHHLNFNLIAYRNSTIMNAEKSSEIHKCILRPFNFCVVFLFVLIVDIFYEKRIRTVCYSTLVVFRKAFEQSFHMILCEAPKCYSLQSGCNVEIHGRVFKSYMHHLSGYV